METELLPSSAFTPDPSVARARPFRDGLTLTLAPEAGAPDAGRLLAGIAVAEPTITEKEPLRTAIDSPSAAPLTITF